MRGESKVVTSTTYLEKLMQLKDNFTVKVITGLRGVGKTNLLLTFAETLRKEGVPQEEIVYINFEEEQNIFDYQQLYEFVNDKIADLEQAYLIFDEIQRVKGWEKAINAFFVGSPVDIYISDSNNSVLSETFLNLLSNNYEVIQMQPLPFKEYLKLVKAGKNVDNEAHFKKYSKFGGLPFITKLEEDEENIFTFLSGIYHTIMNKDIIARYGVRDAELLDSVNRCLAINIGKPITPKVIDSYLENIGQITTIYTMENYFRMINESGLFRRVARYDIKTRTKLNGSEQFYCADLGILNMLSRKFSLENRFIAENIIYIELLREGYDVFIGKNGPIKIDFVAIKDSKPTYIHIVDKIGAKNNLRKTFHPLHRINDQYDKIVVSLEKPKIKDHNGIKIVSIFDFINGKV